MNLFQKAYRRVFRLGITKMRVLHYRLLSGNTFEGTTPVCFQPLLIMGDGEVSFDGSCKFGFFASPGFYSSYAYIEARDKTSRISFGDGSHFNNNFQVIANEGSIRFGSNLRVGMNCQVINSDFHNLDVRVRNTPPFASADVYIGNDIFIGNNVTILKGVTIGDNAVIGSGSVVVSDIPANCVAGGIPAKVLRKMDVR